MITCEQVQHYFEAYLNDEIAAGLVAEVDAHCLECETCRKQLRLMEACGNVIRLDTSEPVLSSDFTDRLVAIMADQPRRYSMQLHRGLRLVGGLLGIAAVLAFAVMSLRSTPTEVVVDAPMVPSVAADNTIPGEGAAVGESLMGRYLGFPVHRLFGVSQSLPGAAELGQITLNKLNDAASADQPGPQPVVFPDFTLPSEPDVQETPPALDDGGELM